VGILGNEKVGGSLVDGRWSTCGPFGPCGSGPDIISVL
jgi:hypothetical protein